jgi:benzoyl-CoA reductase subunit BamB
MGAFSDLDFGLRIAQKATEYGLDGFSTPQVMAFGLELLEDGILSKDDFPGLPEDNEGKFYYLLDKIVNREGIGDILANGTHWAAKEIGNGAEEYAHNNIKKHEQLPLKLSMLNPIYFLMYCTGEKMNITQISLPFYPTVEMTCDIVDWQERMHYIDDALGQCAGLSSFPLKPPYHIHNYPKFISFGAGIDMDEDKLTEAATRYRTLVRAINIRRGLRRKDERPPEDHWKKRFPELEEELLDSYYKLKGWNNDGIPTKEALHKMGLDYVAEEFIERGILTDGEDAPLEEALAEKETN